MKRLITLLLLSSFAFVLAGCGQQAVTAAPEGTTLTMRPESEPLAVGETVLIVSLTDASGAAIDGATLAVHGDMDHEGMEPVDREVSTSTDGEYRVPFEWTMGGGWIVTVTAQLPDNGGAISETFEFFVEAISSESIINQHTAEATAEATPPVADVQIAYQPDTDPAQTGAASVTITLTDAAGQPITDATVEVVGNMAHHGMVPVIASGEHRTDGQYPVALTWTMSGDWQVTVNITLPDGSQASQTFDQVVEVAN